MIERLLIARDAPLHLDDHGFVLWPGDDEHAEAYNPELRRWSDISEKTVVVILGEPGIGKSIYLEQARSIEAGPSRWVDLGIYSDQFTLEKAVFGSQDASRHEESLTLFLDGLDESKLSIPTVERCLRQRFETTEAGSLRLRIGCRTAVWSSQLEEFLVKKWGEDQVAVMELVPLRAVDARARAAEERVNPEAFLAEVSDRAVGALAARPITLNFLLDIFSKSKTLPQSRYEIYRQGCLHLVDEKNPGRIESRRIGKLFPSERLVLAGRIAAISMFSNHGLITSRSQIHSGISTITPEDVLAEPSAQAHSTMAMFDREDVEEVLDTGLFNARGSDYLGWAHQSFAEFLAAHCLAECRAETTKAITLFRNVNDAGRRVAPQLWETAAWYSMRNPDFLEWLLAHEPEIVLESDVQISDAAARKNVVCTILEKAHAKRYFDTNWTSRRRYVRFLHPGLAEQLSPYVTGQQYGYVARRIATDIAEACKLEALAEPLAKVALDKSEDHHIRVNAAYAVLRIGKDSAKRQLRPLLRPGKGEDEDDELKGVAIKSLWPDSLQANELFEILTPPLKPNFVGAYATLFDVGTATHLKGCDCIPGLEWVQRLSRQQLQDFTVGRLADAVMQRAVQFIDDELVRRTFAKTAWYLLDEHDAIFVRRWGGDKPTSLLDDALLRRKLAKALLDLCENPEKDGFKLFHQGECVLRDEDIAWLIDELRTANSDLQRILSGLISYRLRYPVEHQIVNLVIDLASDSTFPASRSLRDAVSWLLEPVALDSQAASEGRKHLAMMRELDDRSKKRSKSIPVLDHLEHGLAHSDAIEGWLIALNAMSRSSDESPIGWVGDNILESHVWRRASPALQHRICAAAYRYLQQAPGASAELLRKDTFNLSELASTPALIVVALGNGSSEFPLTKDIWAKQARSLIVTFHSHERRSQWQTLLKLAAAAAPDELHNAFRERLDYEVVKEGYVHVTHKIAPIWDRKYEEIAVEAVSSRNIADESLRSLGNFLMEHSPERARTVVQDIMSARLAISSHDDKAVLCAAMLAQHDAPQSWGLIWRAVCHDAEFGRKWTLAAAGAHGEQSNILSISERQLADLYIWLHHAFPPNEDPQLDGWVSPRHNIADLRGNIPRALEKRGTLLALDALDRIVAKIPDHEWLRAVRFDAEKTVRRGTWLPLSPEELRAMLDDPESTVARDDEELAGLVLASLAKLQERLSGWGGAPKLATTVWDEYSKRPKTETRLSECIETHLRDDIAKIGAIVNREVEIRNYHGQGIGERVDLLVSSRKPQGAARPEPPLTLAMEIKGCWNIDLHEAMETQLVGQYLSRGGLRVGLYVVGLFQCAEWASDDPRKSVSLRNTGGDLKSLNERLHKQAATLETNRIRVTPYVLDVRLLKGQS